MLSAEQIASYRENGFLAVESVFSPDEMAAARRAVEEMVERSRSITEHDDVYDLEPGHSAAEPRVRRLKAPLAADPLFLRLAQSDRLMEIVAALIGPAIRLHGSKLNMKSAGYGSPVEWHQDFVFFFFFFVVVFAIGDALDECLVENG